MRKSFKGLKRPLAMAMAVAMVAASVPERTAFAAAETVQQTEEAGTEVVDNTEEATGEETAGNTEAVAGEETAGNTEEAPGEETAENTEEAPEEETAGNTEEGEGEGATVNTEEAAVENTEETTGEAEDSGEAAKKEAAENTEAAPAEDTKEENKTEKRTEDKQRIAAKPAAPSVSIGGRRLSWTPVPGAFKYEIAVTDGTYHYFNNYKVNEAGKYEGIHISVSNSNNTDLVSALIPGGYLLPINAEGEIVYKDTNGNDITSFTPGKTYSYKVRAVNKNEATGELVYGDWSAEDVTYRVPDLQRITDLAFVKYDENTKKHLFTYSNEVKEGYIVYEYSTDPDFKANTYYDKYSNSAAPGLEYKMQVDLNRFPAGSTVYVRAYNEIDGFYLTDASDNQIYSNTVAVTLPQEKQITAKNITNLRVKKKSIDGFEMTFDAVLDNPAYWDGVRETENWKTSSDRDLYELEYSTTPDFSSDVEKTDLEISYGSLKAGVNYYVRARAFRYNPETDDFVYGAYSNTAVISYNKITHISNLKLKENTQSAYVFGYTGTLQPTEKIELQLSTAANFPADVEKTETVFFDQDEEAAVSYGAVSPGKYYVRARVVDWTYSEADTMEDFVFSNYTNVVTLNVKVPDVSVATKDVTAKSVTLNMNRGDDSFYTGYEVQKKVNGKYTKLQKTTENVYTDKGLESDTTYSYRVRAYYYDTENKKTYNGAWEYISTTTWGAAITLKAEAVSASSVKLSWNKVSGANGYEVYRKAGSSYSTNTSRGSVSSYEKYELVKTINKASTKAYTDKKLRKNENYSYVVRAFKTVNNKKYYIQSNYDSASLSFGSAIKLTSYSQGTNGKVTVTWKRTALAKGYVIDRYNEDTSKWETYKKISKNSTVKAVLPAAAGSKPVEYRIRAYKGNEYSDSTELYVNPYMAAPKNVKASAQKDGSVKITWSAVKGADYYKVYRTTDSSYTYNKSTKEYEYNNEKLVSVYEEDQTSKTGYRRLGGKELTGTSAVDRNISYISSYTGKEVDVYEGPQPGVTYNYFVVAYKNTASYIYSDYINNEPTYVEYTQSVNSKAAKTKVTNVTVKTPAIRSAKSTKAGTVTVTWKKVSGAQGYEVFRSTKKGSGYVKIGTVTKGSTVKFTDKKALRGKTCYYKVRAVKANEAGADAYSKYSKVKKVKVK